VPYTAVTGNFLTSSLWNTQVRDASAFFAGVPAFSGYQSVAQSIPNGNAWASLLIDSETLDNYGGHSTSTNTSRYTPQVAGTYAVFGGVAWVANTTGDRRIQVTLNGNAVLGSANSMDPTQNVLAAQQTMAFVTVNGTTDYIEIQVSHSSSAALSTNNGSGASAMFTSSMRAVWICS
jgi:hypothetical protein